MNKKSVVVKLHRKMDSVRDATEKIASALGYTPDNQRIVIILRHEPFSSTKGSSATSVRSEVYNLSWRMSKLVEEGPRLDSFNSESLTTGVLYVEEGDTKEKNENFAWHKEFNKAYDNINLVFTDPTDNLDSETFKVRL